VRTRHNFHQTGHMFLLESLALLVTMEPMLFLGAA
jgi:hypothetical protein